MAKSLVDKLQDGFRSIRRNFKSIILSATAGLFLYGAQCVPNPPPKPEPPENNPPTANLYVSPNYGQAPLPVSIKLDGDDANGKEDIVEYITGIDKNENNEIDNDEIIKTDSYPINEEIIFNTAGTYKILGQVTDSKGLTDKKSLSVIVSNPYDPTADVNSIPESEKNFNEESQTIINLPAPYDLNSEDNPVSYTNATSLDQKVEVDKNMLSGNKLILTGNEDLTGTYQVKLELENIKGEKGEVILQGEIYNLIDLSGMLQDNETDTNQAGVIRVYDASDNSLLEEILTSDGNFGHLQLSKRVSQAILQARIMNGSTPASYVRTIRLSGNIDHNPITDPRGNPAIRAVMYDNPNDSYDDELIDNGSGGQITPEQFRAHLEDTNTGPIGQSYHGLNKFDLENFIGFEILKYNHQGTSFGEFSSGTGGKQERIRDKILNKYDIGGMFEGEPNNGRLRLKNGRLITIQIDTELNPSNKRYNESGEPDLGWIIIEPDNDPLLGIENGLGAAEPFNYSGVPGQVDASLIKMKGSNISPDFPYDFVIDHEGGGHASNVAPYEANAPNHLTYPLTVMETNINPPTGPTTMGKADLKEAPVVHDETYLPREKSDDILGMDFY